MRLKSDKIQENNLGLKLMNYIIERYILLKVQEIKLKVLLVKKQNLLLMKLGVTLVEL